MGYFFRKMFKTFAFTAIVAAASAAEWGPHGYGAPSHHAPHHGRSFRSAHDSRRPARPSRSFAKPARPSRKRTFSAPRVNIGAPSKGSFHIGAPSRHSLGPHISAPSRHSFSAPKRSHRPHSFQGAVKKAPVHRQEKKHSLHGVELRHPGAGYSYGGPFTGRGAIAEPRLDLDQGRHSQYGRTYGFGGFGTGPQLHAPRLHHDVSHDKRRSHGSKPRSHFGYGFGGHFTGHGAIA